MIALLETDGSLHPLNRLDKCSRTHLLEPVLETFPGLQIVQSTDWREIFPFDVWRETLIPIVAARRVVTTRSIHAGRWAISKIAWVHWANTNAVAGLQSVKALTRPEPAHRRARHLQRNGACVWV